MESNERKANHLVQVGRAGRGRRPLSLSTRCGGERHAAKSVSRDRRGRRHGSSTAKGIRDSGKNHGHQIKSFLDSQRVRPQRARGRWEPPPASHTTQAGDDEFIWTERGLLNQRKREKAMLWEEGDVDVLDLFVIVPVTVNLPVKYKPMEIDAINPVMADNKPQEKR